MSRVLRLSVSSAVVIAALAFSATAQAQITIGQLAPGTSPFAYCINGPYDSAAFGSAAATYTVPTAGVITSWSTNAAAGAGQQLAFKVYRPLGGGKYLVVGHNGPQMLAPSAVDTFPTSIPVQAGDLIGNVDTNASIVNTACEFETGNAEDESWSAAGEAADGATIEEIAGEHEDGVRLNETATLLPPPTVSTVTPASGSLAGGSSVALAGTNLAEVKAVAFGATPATSFIVNSESQITAIAPPSATASGVPVTVTTVAGTATSPTPFTYQAPPVHCVVPKLNGKKLNAAKKKLKAADCKIGKVTKKKGATSKSGKVGKQSPKAGKVLAPGSKVKVTLKA